MTTARRLTALRPDARVPGHLVVEIDGVRFASVPAEVVTALGLRRGQELRGREYERLATVAEVEAAYRVAVRSLAARPRSVSELRRKLSQKGHAARAVQEVTARLEARGFLDDGEFARHFARARFGNGHGPNRIRTDLLARGVHREVAEEAIAEVLDREGVNVLAQARALAVKRSAQLSDLPREAKLRRLLGYLARRGYSGRDVTELTIEILDADST